MKSYFFKYTLFIGFYSRTIKTIAFKPFVSKLYVYAGKATHISGNNLNKMKHPPFLFAFEFFFHLISHMWLLSGFGFYVCCQCWSRNYAYA